MSKTRNLVVFGLVAFAGQAAWGQACPEGEWCQWTVAEGGNGHWYRSTGPGTWDAAELEAVQAGGHLVTINDAAENAWLVEKFPRDTTAQPHYWIGFYQDTSDSDYSEPSGAWKWIGDPNLCEWQAGNPNVCYTTWHVSSGEPNDGAAQPPEDHADLHWGSGSDQGTWNDRHGDTEGAGIMEREKDPSIPTVSEWGLIAMVLALVAGGTIVLRQRRLAA